MLDVMDIILITVLTGGVLMVGRCLINGPSTIVNWRFFTKRYKEIMGFSMMNSYRIFLDKKKNCFVYVGITDNQDIAEHTLVSKLDKGTLSDLLKIRDDCYFIKSMIKPFKDTVKKYLEVN